MESQVKRGKFECLKYGPKKGNGTILLKKRLTMYYYSNNYTVFWLNYKRFYVVESEKPMEREGKYFQ